MCLIVLVAVGWLLTALGNDGLARGLEGQPLPHSLLVHGLRAVARLVSELLAVQALHGRTVPVLALALAAPPLLGLGAVPGGVANCTAVEALHVIVALPAAPATATVAPAAALPSSALLAVAIAVAVATALATAAAALALLLAPLLLLSLQPVAPQRGLLPGRGKLLLDALIHAHLLSCRSRSLWQHGHKRVDDLLHPGLAVGTLPHQHLQWARIVEARHF
mmetsp:Transcript_113694/g.316612  ORF Transcript_113694/g.316612 Transcript_113694/m.316612 type:complete len:221 (+) Transcript_113694:100-762(+)